MRFHDADLGKQCLWLVKPVPHIYFTVIRVRSIGIITMARWRPEYFCWILNDLHQLTDIDLMFDSTWNLMPISEGACLCACVCVCVSSCVGKRERVFAFFKMLHGLHVQKYVSMLVWVFVCVCKLPVCVLMCMHVFCPLTAYLYPHCDVFLGGFRKGQEKHVEDLIFSGSSVRSGLQRSSASCFLCLVSCWCCTWRTSASCAA